MAILEDFHLIADSALFAQSQEILFPLLHFCRQHLETEVTAVRHPVLMMQDQLTGKGIFTRDVDPKAVPSLKLKADDWKMGPKNQLQYTLPETNIDNIAPKNG